MIVTGSRELFFTTTSRFLHFAFCYLLKDGQARTSIAHLYYAAAYLRSLPLQHRYVVSVQALW